jgi:ubiquinone/menaquinone biosynthesis C-methylase UbiE
MSIHAQTTGNTEGWQLEASSAEAYEKYLATAFSRWAQQLTAMAGISEGARVLDVACGTGIVARHAAQRAGVSGRVVGLDVNDDMLEVARAVSAGITPAIEWRRGNAADLPFPPASFDAICCEQAIQFFSDPVNALREMRRVAAPGARVAVSVCRPLRFAPAYVALAGALDRHVGSQASAIMRAPFPSWTTSEFREMFNAARWETVHVNIVVDALRYPTTTEFLRQEASSSPLAPTISGLTAEIRDAIIRDLDAALAEYIDDDGVVCPVEAYVAVARAGTTART